MLCLKGNDRKIISDENIVISTFGRIYVNLNTVSFYEKIMNKFRYEDKYTCKLKTIDLNKIIDYSTKNIEYLYDACEEKEMITLLRYINISNDFMKWLIENNENSSFRIAITKYLDRNKKISKKDSEKLLKPVYIRFEKLKKYNALENIDTEKIPEQVTLYDIDNNFSNGKLKLLDKISLDLREVFGNNIYMPISIGEMYKFEKVIINIEKCQNPINFNGIELEYRIKYIELIAKVEY